MKLCTKCKFEIVNKDESWCKNCKKEYLKFYRENNKGHCTWDFSLVEECRDYKAESEVDK